MKNKFGQNPLVYIYILLMTFAFTAKYVDIRVNPIFQYIFAFIVIGLALLAYLMQKKQNNFKYKNIFIFIFKYYFLPVLLIHLYSIFMIFIGVFDKQYLCTNISSYIPILLVMSSVYLFKEKAFDYSLIALILSWLLSVITSVIFKGFEIFPYAILQAYFNNSTPIGDVSKNYLEMHDLVLSMGAIFIYYVLFINKKNKSKVLLAVMLLIIILGFKRISIFGLFVVFIFYYFIKFFNDKSKYKISKFCGIFILVGCYLFVYLIVDGNLVDLLMTKYNIRLMGRNYYYEAIAKYGDFSISFLGIGRSGVTKILTGPLSYLRVGGVHSDILKMFIENGFIVFGLWLWHYLIRIPKAYSKYFGTSSLMLYICLTIYTFILYITDNVENYFVYQFFYILIPITHIFNSNLINKKSCNINKKIVTNVV